jgi:hemoglobin
MSLYEEVGGFDRLLALCRAWHARLKQDPLAWHPFEHGFHPRHDERLAAYLAEAFGGPALYTAGYGDESAMLRIHAGHGEHVELDEACLKAFDLAVTDVGLTGPAAERVSAYFRRATESQREWGDGSKPVPDGLPFNHEQGGDADAGVQAWVHEAEVEVEADADPRAVGAAVTVALCGHWEHEGPCRWPHNNAIDGRLFRTLFVCRSDEEPAVRALIRSALGASSDWRIVSECARKVDEEEHTLASHLLRTPRRT